MTSSRLAANVAWLFPGLPWLDRFAAARDAGFAAVEFPWPDDPEATARAVRDAGLRVVLMNVAAGDLAAGERGWPNDPARRDAWRAAMRAALDLAADVGCPTLNVLAGNRVGHADAAAQLACLEDNLAWACERAAARAVTVVSELMNRRENPDYLLVDWEDCVPLLDRLGPLGWRIQLDTHHLALTEDDVPAAIRRANGRIGHLQVSDAPGRHEPGSGALDWPAIGRALADAGYAGPVALEYVPLRDPAEVAAQGFEWLVSR
ncbi:MAG TPA: TIM barrel protein [Candidatus Limnocylindria bacterium]|nr:TIM barrel protein [Candidatus Limnocylindria bacterium]